MTPRAVRPALARVFAAELPDARLALVVRRALAIDRMPVSSSPADGETSPSARLTTPPASEPARAPRAGSHPPPALTDAGHFEPAARAPRPAGELSTFPAGLSCSGVAGEALVIWERMR